MSVKVAVMMIRGWAAGPAMSRQAIARLTLGLCAGGVALVPSPASAQGQLRVMTWNIAHADSGVATIAGYIKARGADVVILQEVNNTSQPAQLESELENQTGATWHMTYHSNCEHGSATGLVRPRRRAELKITTA